VPWSPLFEDPIILPRGRKLLTLKDAADYITKLPRKESDLPERQTAAEKSKDQLSRDFWGRSIFDCCNNTVKIGHAARPTTALCQCAVIGKSGPLN
jgi:hypothetical protein